MLLERYHELAFYIHAVLANIIIHHLFRWHLILFFTTAVILGYIWSHPATVVNELDLQGIPIREGLAVFSSSGDYFIAIIFVISGLNLSTKDLTASVLNKKTTIFPIISILILSPLVALWTISWKFTTDGYTFGLALGLIQATTLSSGPIIVAQAEGNVALALFLTVSTNFLAVFTVPFFLNLIMQEDESTELKTANIIVHLLLVILLPLILGKILAFYLNSSSERVKIWSKLCSSFCLSLIIWSVVGKSSDAFNDIDLGSTILLATAIIGIHMFLLIMNLSISRYILKLSYPEEVAITFCCSQKTLPVAVTILEKVDPPGVPIIPLLLIQLIQIVIDAALAAYWAPNQDIDPENRQEDEIPVENDKEASKELNEDVTEIKLS